ncbi:MAG: glycine/betaine/sarcosine/D-proline family reductase selenoprotein B [Dehalococcoidia bacterium]
MGEKQGNIRVLHFLNPFFAGIGGEEANERGPQVEVGSRGPGRKMDELLGDAGQIVATVICGDNYFTANEAEATDVVCRTAKEHGAHVVIAGPAFNAGRYGLACARVCRAANQRLRLPAVTAMSPENPGAAFRRERVYIVPSGDSVQTMGEVLPRLARLALKLARQEPLASAAVEGYLPRGIRMNERLEKSSAQRAVDMLLAKLRGEPYKTEIRLEQQDRAAPPPALPTLEDAVIALVTETGFIPHGNPDRIPSARARVWGRYSVADLDDLTSDQFTYIHGGYDTRRVDQDPDRGVPLDALRQLEREGQFKRLMDEVFSTCGNGGSLNEMKRIGQEMAAEIKQRGATAVIVPST